MDPSYPSFHPVRCPIPASARVIVSLYQYNEEDTPMSWFTSSESVWVAMVYSTQLRVNIQATGYLEIWCSNNIHDDEFQMPSPLLWVPVPSSTNIHLATYLENMSGSQYLTGSIPVAATDGAYRRARDGNISSPMGAGVT